MISGAVMSGAVPGVVPGNGQEEENSDLEVVDVISALPSRPARDPEVVELSDSESEPGDGTSGQNQPGQSAASQAGEAEDDVIYIISSDEEGEGGQPAGEQGYSAGSMVPPYMRMSLMYRWSQTSWKKAESPAESSDEDDLIVVKTEHNTIDPITKKQIVEPVKNKKCNHIYEKSTIYSMIDLAR